MINTADKPAIKNTACLLHNIVGHSDEKAETLRNKILSAVSSNKNSGTTWYISNNGNDSNEGNSIDKPWASIEAINLNNEKIKFGDNILFACGDVFRGNIIAKNGVYYGSFGAGEKPCIYASKCNYALETWEETEPYIWKIDFAFDAGIIVFNHGEIVGAKKHFSEVLDTDLDFTCKDNCIFLYSIDNPSKRFNSIEIGDLTHIFRLPPNTNNVTIDNLTIKYTGGMGIQIDNNSENITIRNCEIGWIGGCYLPNYKDGKTRFGNGIEFWGGVNNALVENCWVYQIYDSGLSHQGSGSFAVENLVFRENLVEYTSFSSIEFWADYQKGSYMKNITYCDNILRFGGYGWGEIRRPYTHAFHILMLGDSYHKCINFKITNNIMELSKRSLLQCRSVLEDVPLLCGNTFIQEKFGILGGYKNIHTPIYRFDDMAEKIVRDQFEDKEAKIIYF